MQVKFPFLFLVRNGISRNISESLSLGIKINFCTCLYTICIGRVFFGVGGGRHFVFSICTWSGFKKINPVPTPNCFFFVLTCDPEMCVKLNFSL